MKRLLIFLLFFSSGSPATELNAEKGAALEVKKVINVFQRLAEKGDPGAQYTLGSIFLSGNGAPQNYKEAAKWYRLAAEQRYGDASLFLAGLYYRGQGVPQDYKEALKWYRLAADQGNALAQGGLGFMYAKGQGVPQDAPTAYMWWNIAAAAGDKDATENRDKLTQLITPSQIEKGQDLTRACIAKNYKGC